MPEVLWQSRKYGFLEMALVALIHMKQSSSFFDQPLQRYKLLPVLVVHHLGFLHGKFWQLMASRGPIRVIVPNFVKIGQTVMEILWFIDFSKMAAVRHLGFAGRVFGPRTNSTRRINRYTKFGCNRGSSFDNMAILILQPFRLKTPVHAPKTEFWGTTEPLNG